MFSYVLEKVKAECPVCDARKASLLYDVSSEEACRHFLVKGQDPKRFSRLKSHIEDLWKAHTCQVLRCQNCGLSFANPFVAGDSQFYALAYDRHGYPSEKWEYTITLKKLLGASNGRKIEDVKLLEIGAGDGAFIRQIAESTVPITNIFCTEYSDYGVTKISNLGVTCLSKNFLSIDLSELGTSFSVVCLFQVLEHMDKLSSVFRRLCSMTSQGASLFIAVPNDKIIEFYEKNGMPLDMPPNHISRWTRKAFDIISERHGWKVVEHRLEPARFLALYKRCAIYHYLKRRQCEGNLSYYVATLSNPKLRRFLEVFLVGLNSIGLIPLSWKMTTQRLGNSQWVHMEKIV